MLNRRLPNFISNVLAIAISFLIAYVLKVGWGVREDLFVNVNGGLVFIYLLFSYLIVFIFYRSSDAKSSSKFKSSGWRLFLETLITVVGVAALFVSIIYATHVGSSIPRMFFAYFFSFYFILNLIFSIFIQWLYARYQEKHKRKAVVFTDSTDRASVVKNLLRDGADDYEIPALVEVNKERKQKLFIVKGNHQIVEDESDALTYLKRHQVDLVILSFKKLGQAQIREIIDKLAEMGVTTLVTLDSFEVGDINSSLEEFGTINVMRLAPRIFTAGEIVAKRIIDIFFGLFGCIFCVIVTIFVAPFIHFEDGGPVFFKQKRVGQNGKIFDIYKFRSMRVDAEKHLKELADKNEMKGLMFKMKDDPRITRTGRFIRKTSLDEFPQFFNVLRGEMSIVGYRPPTVDEYENYKAKYKRRMMLKPGITGLWQVNGRSEVNDFDEVLKFDNYYIDHWSVWLDIKIILKTIPAVLSGRGSE